MSYDLTFLHKDEDESWEEALEALEQRVVAGGDSGPPDEHAWARIVADSRRILGPEVDEHRLADFFELDHEPTGIQLSLFSHEAGITVPYWYQGAEAAVIMELVYQLARVIERHTGMTGYDGQVGMSVAEAIGRPRSAVKVFDMVATSFAQRGIGTPSNDADDWEVEI